MYFLELFQGKYLRQIQTHLHYQMKCSDFEIKIIKEIEPKICISIFAEQIVEYGWL